jgi:hypothetical protein
MDAEQKPTAKLETNPLFKAEGHLPVLETGLLGELPDEAEEETRTWDRALPFMAQMVIDFGFDLPNPYGVGGVLAHVEQDIVLSDLIVGLNGGEKQEIDFVDFGQPFTENNAAQFKLDTWLFPFMNVYAVLGKFDGDAVIPIAVPGDELLKFLLPELGGLCDRQPGFPGRPPVCDELLTGTAFPRYEGTNIGIGTTLAMGWRNYFVAIPATYVKTDINIVDSSIETTQVAPRIGFTIDQEGPGMLALYVGGSWMDVDLELSGQVTLAAPGAQADETYTIDFSVREQNKDEWNYLAGLNWDINANWSLQAEVGFGGSREHLISSFVYRW